MSLGALVSGFGTGYQHSENIRRGRKADEQSEKRTQLAERQAQLAEAADGRAAEQLALTREQADRVRQREEAIRGVYSEMAADLAQRTGRQTAAPVATPGMPQSGEALADAPRPEDQVGAALIGNPNVLSDPEFLRATAQRFLKAGMPEGVLWLDKIAKAQEEGTVGALRKLISGDMRGAAEAFNQSGKMRITGEITANPDGTFTIPIDGEPQQINAREMLAMYRPLDAQRIAQASYLSGRNATAENVAETRAGAQVATASTRAQQGITIAQINAQSRGQRAAGGGTGTGSNVQSVQPNADGTRTLVFRDGTSRLLVGEDGEPIRGLTETQLAALLYRDSTKDPLAKPSPAAARGTAEEIVRGKPKPKPAPAPANRRPLDAFQR